MYVQHGIGIKALGRVTLNLAAAQKWNRDVGYAKYGWRTRDSVYRAGPGDEQLAKDVWYAQHLMLGCKGQALNTGGVDCIGRDGMLGKQTMQLIVDATSKIQNGKSPEIDRLRAGIVMPTGIKPGDAIPQIPCADLAAAYRALRSDCRTSGRNQSNGGGGTGGGGTGGGGTGGGGTGGGSSVPPPGFLPPDGDSTDGGHGTGTTGGKGFLGSGVPTGPAVVGLGLIAGGAWWYFKGRKGRK